MFGSCLGKMRGPSLPISIQGDAFVRESRNGGAREREKEGEKEPGRDRATAKSTEKRKKASTHQHSRRFIFPTGLRDPSYQVARLGQLRSLQTHAGVHPWRETEAGDRGGVRHRRYRESERKREERSERYRASERETCSQEREEQRDRQRQREQDITGYSEKKIEK